MRYPSTRDPFRDPRPKHSLRTTVTGTVAATLLIPLLVLAVSYPGAVAALVGLALATWPLVKGYRRLHRTRRREGRTRRVCVPATDTCVEV